MADDLKRAISSALSWIRANKSQFALPVGPTSESTLKAIKPLGELSLVLEKIDQGELLANPAELLDWCWAQFRGGDLMLEILQARHDLIVLCTIYASFVQKGYFNRRLSSWIDYLRSTRAHQGIEFPRWRRLDVDHALAKLDGTCLGENPLRDTWIVGLPEPWLMSDDTAYAVTHSLFYVTDFGSTPAALPENVREYLHLWLPAWLEVARRQRNFDLFAEWLMVAAYSGFGEIFDEHAEALISHQRGDGVFPGPTGSAETLLTGEISEVRADFLKNYHTTLVAVLALASRAALRPHDSINSAIVAAGD
jgi:hypothetical protein